MASFLVTPNIRMVWADTAHPVACFIYFSSWNIIEVGYV
uniref:Uncharacterized protein n=1 Tax=Arundo donax TaxID=35708 RepID=A0A0A9AQS7_ARUDO